MVATFEKLGLHKTRPSMYAMIQSMSTQEANQDGISFDLFIMNVLNYFGDRYSEDGLRHIFSLFDEDGDGVINRGAFKKMAEELGVRIDRREMEDIFMKASSDERVITYKDFEVFMKREAEVGKR